MASADNSILVELTNFPGRPLIGSRWVDAFLQAETSLLQSIKTSLGKRLALGEEIVPPLIEVFRFTHYCAPDKIKVILVGQDPYPTGGWADGLAFSSAATISPSLKRIFAEIKNSTGQTRTDSDLTGWARQGVLLVNATMTRRPGKNGDHKDVDWLPFTMHLIKTVMSSVKCRPDNNSLIFILLGAQAKRITQWITSPERGIHFLTAGHPSPLNVTVPFMESGIFKRCNDILGPERAVAWGG